MKNTIRSLLCELGICDDDSIVPFYPKVRDRNDVSVLRCNKSGVILLSRSDHINSSHYEDREDFKYWGAEDRKAAILLNAEDDQRRSDQFENIIRGKKWMDVGTGVGGILDLLAPVASETIAVELQKTARDSLIDAGYQVYPAIKEVQEDDMDIITLFHVLEHFTDPIESLKLIRSKIRKGGNIIVEVPHANDFLISFLEVEAFKAFTFWSEHLILHTHQSLRTFLEEAGFSNIAIEGVQRYPLANHLYWLSKGKPGGHIHWSHLRTSELEVAYSKILASLDKTDTLIAIAES